MTLFQVHKTYIIKNEIDYEKLHENNGRESVIAHGNELTRYLPGSREIK
jgi:hypothetical protein